MKFKENVIKPGMAIHCPKEEDARALYEHLKKNGYEDIDYMTKHYSKYGGNTCYEIEQIFDKQKNIIGYSDIEYFKKICSRTITEFSDLIEPEPRFKVGDRAIVRDDLIIGKDYGDCEFAKGMELFKGKIVTIKECFPGGGYKIEEDDKKWLWSNSMLKTMENVDENKSTEMSAVEVLEWFRENYKNYDTMRKVFGHDLAFFRRIIVDNSPQKIIENITAYEAAKKTPKPVEVEWVDFYGIFDHEGQLMEYYDNLTKTEFEKEFRKYIEEHGNGYHAKVERQCRVKEDGVSE